MHSSRMRTDRSLTVCCSLLPGGVSAWSGGVLLGPGGCLPLPGGFSLVRGGSPWSGGVLLGPRGVFSLVQGGVFSLVPRGALLGRGGSPWSGGFSGDPPVDRITDTCKNITLATTSLRPVNILNGKCRNKNVLEN